ncbi:MAG TPA: GreA/GreB family elongation factor [Actinomycetota bacterium]|nr:GreA/GreB family elongation factor [Actinomycetota bacterium]
MIRTLTVGSDPREELRCRLRFLQDVEVPLLSSEWGESGHLGSSALKVFSQREIRDASRLLADLSEPLKEVGPEETVRLNDCVALREPGEQNAEEFVVHAPGLVVRAPGFLSADSPLGAAVLGKKAGEPVTFKTPAGSRSYLLQGIRRSAS